MDLSLFNYDLPKELIAQQPVQPRDACRLLVFNRNTEEIFDDYFFNLIKYLTPGDVLIFNDTKVIPARLFGFKSTRGRVEVFLLKNLDLFHWNVLLKGRIHLFNEIFFDKDLKCLVESRKKDGTYIIKFNKSKDFILEYIEKQGFTPLPPYIKVSETFKDNELLREYYQTVYSKIKGSVAAPTAGLHFTKKLLKRLSNFGVQFEFVTLHVGYGTFAPIKTKDITKHKMHSEQVYVKAEVIKRILEYKKQNKRIIAVGTTSVRVLEGVVGKFLNVKGNIEDYQGEVDIFIYPGFKFKIIDGLITNFHLPKSSLLVLVSAFIGREKCLEVYKYAINKKYKFYSFGDAMLIL